MSELAGVRSSMFIFGISRVQFPVLMRASLTMGIWKSWMFWRKEDNMVSYILTQVVYFEPVANPSLDVIDVKAVVEMAHEAGTLVVVDNTFVTPYMFQQLRLGVDIVIHSATKYLCGHADALGGVVIADNEIISRLRKTRNIYGGVISPFNAFLYCQHTCEKTLYFRTPTRYTAVTSSTCRKGVPEDGTEDTSPSASGADSKHR